MAVILSRPQCVNTWQWCSVLTVACVVDQRALVDSWQWPQASLRGKGATCNWSIGPSPGAETTAEKTAQIEVSVNIVGKSHLYLWATIGSLSQTDHHK